MPDELNPLGRADGVFVLGAVFQIARGIRTSLEREATPSGITSQQAGLLLRAWRHGGVTPSALAAPLGTDTAGMTRLVDRLEAKGLVVRERSPLDRRSVVIRLSEAGNALIPQIAPVFEQVNAGLLRGLTKGEKRQLMSLLQRLHDNLRRMEQASVA